MAASSRRRGDSSVWTDRGAWWWLTLAALGALVMADGARAQSAQGAQNTPRDSAQAKAGKMGQPIEIFLDVSRAIRVPDGTATLVVGNPLIADASVETGGLLVVTGKGYGVTNLMAFDAKGTLLMEHPIEVKGPVDRVTVYRGVNRESYSCLPDCERRIVLGDSADYFASTLGQSGALNTQARGTDSR